MSWKNTKLEPPQWNNRTAHGGKHVKSGPLNGQWPKIQPSKTQPMKSVTANVCLVRPKHNSEVSIHLNLCSSLGPKHTQITRLLGQPLKSLPKTVKTQRNQFQRRPWREKTNPQHHWRQASGWASGPLSLYFSRHENWRGPTISFSPEMWKNLPHIQKQHAFAQTSTAHATIDVATHKNCPWSKKFQNYAKIPNFPGNNIKTCG